MGSVEYCGGCGILWGGRGGVEGYGGVEYCGGV